MSDSVVPPRHVLCAQYLLFTSLDPVFALRVFILRKIVNVCAYSMLYPLCDHPLTESL